VSYHRTFEEAKTAADTSNEPLEIEEHRSSKNISPEEQEKQDKDYQEWRKRELTGELFEDFWWKGEMNRYGNSDSPYLRYSTIPDKDKKAFDDTKFFDEHILPKEYNWREKESHQWIAHRWGISERLAQIIESSRTFGMYMNQRNSPATIKKYRQRILDAFDDYTPTTDKEKKMLEIVRNDMATRGVKGPSPSYWCASGRGILKKPELSYAYDDYYTMPIPFMGYGKIADHEKYGIHPACKGCDQCETYESEGIGQWEIGEQLEEAQMNAEDEKEKCPSCQEVKWIQEDGACDDCRYCEYCEEHHPDEAWDICNAHHYDKYAYAAPKGKGINLFTEPFEEMALDSGNFKKVIVGIGIGVAAILTYNKWK